MRNPATERERERQKKDQMRRYRRKKDERVAINNRESMEKMKAKISRDQKKKDNVFEQDTTKGECLLLLAKSC